MHGVNTADRGLEGEEGFISKAVRYVGDTEQVSHSPRWINGEVLPTNRLSWKYLGCKCN